MSQGYFLRDLLGLIKFGTSQEEYNSCCESQTKTKQPFLCVPPLQHHCKLVNSLGRICLTYAYQLESSVYIYNVIPVRIIQEICFDLPFISGHLGLAYKKKKLNYKSLRKLISTKPKTSEWSSMLFLPSSTCQISSKEF